LYVVSMEVIVIADVLKNNNIFARVSLYFKNTVIR
jgi:hypothetical protein